MRPNLPIALRLARIVVSACLLLSVLCLLERPACAYVDPGSGLLAFQSLTAFITGGLFYFRQKIKRLFRQKFPAEHDPPAPTKDTHDTPDLGDKI
jgi:hypothetical protein